MLRRVFLVHLRLAFRALVAATPVAADLLIEKIVGCQIGPLGMGKFLLHFAQETIIHVGTYGWVGIARGRAAEGLSTLDLPADVGSAVERLSGQRRFGKEFVEQRVKPHRILRGATAAATLAGLRL